MMMMIQREGDDPKLCLPQTPDFSSCADPRAHVCLQGNNGKCLSDKKNCGYARGKETAGGEKSRDVCEHLSLRVSAGIET